MIMATSLRSPDHSTDWSKCFICQTDTVEKVLICTDASYKKIQENIVEFQKHDCMPVQINIDRLNSRGNSVAKWHKSCYFKFCTSKLDRAKKRQNEDEDNAGSYSKKIFTRSSTSNEAGVQVNSSKSEKREICFFCSNTESKGKLHEVCTFQLDCRVRNCAQKLQDQELLSKLSEGDLIALEAKYHVKCLVNLYNKTRTKGQDFSSSCKERTCRGIALAELITYIEESRCEDDVKVFKLADLIKLYEKRLKSLGVNVNRANSTRLKEKILLYMPEIVAYNEGRDVFLAYREDVGGFLRHDYDSDGDELGIVMTKISNIIRKDIFSQTVSFSGSFDEKSQVESVPQSLLSLVSMLINGSNIEDRAQNTSLSQPVLTIAQLLVFNSFKRQRNIKPKPIEIHHNKEREMPLPLYLGLKAYALSRERQLVDSLFTIGLSTSYNRIMDIVTSLGNNVCDYCVPHLHRL